MIIFNSLINDLKDTKLSHSKSKRLNSEYPNIINSHHQLLEINDGNTTLDFKNQPKLLSNNNRLSQSFKVIMVGIHGFYLMTIHSIFTLKE